MSSYIYYGQYTGISLLSAYIQLFTWSSRSHTAAFFPPVDGQYHKVIEAWRKGVACSHWVENHRPGTIIDIYRVPCTPEQSMTFYTGLEQEIGKGYDFLGVLAFRLRMNLQRPKRWFCSELIFQKALDAGIILLADIPSWKVSPDKLDLVPHKQWVTRLTVPKKGVLA